MGLSALSLTGPRAARGRDTKLQDVGGAIAIVVILAVFPVLVGLSGAVVAALLGSFVKIDVDRRHAGSELLEHDD